MVDNGFRRCVTTASPRLTPRGAESAHPTAPASLMELQREVERRRGAGHRLGERADQGDPRAGAGHSPGLGETAIDPLPGRITLGTRDPLELPDLLEGLVDIWCIASDNRSRRCAVSSAAVTPRSPPVQRTIATTHSTSERPTRAACMPHPSSDPASSYDRFRTMQTPETQVGPSSGGVGSTIQLDPTLTTAGPHTRASPRPSSSP